jgi:quercetin dioxygenase-like cupin family protein
MKKLLLILLVGTIVSACNQENKTETDHANHELKDTLASAQKLPDSLNIDIVQTSPNQARVLMENEHVRVVEYAVKPGEKDVWHTHPPRSSYVVSGGKVKVYTENGEPKISEVKTGASSWAGQGAKHYVENIGDTDIKIILTEIKGLGLKD